MSLEALRQAAIGVLTRTATDARTARIFEIAYHKCEYVGDAAGVRERHVESQQECTKTIEAGFRACVAAGQLPASVNPREAAIGTLSFVSGLIASWVLAPKSFSLERHAESMVNTFFRGLATVAKPAAPEPKRRKTHAKALARR